MTRRAALTGTHRSPDEHPDSVLPDDDTVRDEESTPRDHTANEGVEEVPRPEPGMAIIPPRRRTR